MCNDSLSHSFFFQLKIAKLSCIGYHLLDLLIILSRVKPTKFNLINVECQPQFIFVLINVTQKIKCLAKEPKFLHPESSTTHQSKQKVGEFVELKSFKIKITEKWVSRCSNKFNMRCSRFITYCFHTILCVGDLIHKWFEF